MVSKCDLEPISDATLDLMDSLSLSGAESAEANADIANVVEFSAAPPLVEETSLESDSPQCELSAPQAAVEAKGGTRKAAPELMEIADRGHGSSIANQALKICIVTNELTEFHQNGGLGTANSGLVLALGARGLSPTVLYSGWIDLQSPTTQVAITNLRNRGVEFYALQDLVPNEWMQAPERISYACYWFLRNADYDIVHFNDYLGNGFYSAQARRTGTVLRNTTIVVSVHGPTRWAMEIDERPFSDLAQQKICLLEHKTLEFADAVIGVSHHLIDWLRGENVKLPKHTYVHKNILPTSIQHPGGQVGIQPGELSNIVFFGRHDIRKGFLIMLQAIKIVSSSLPHVKFTFLGKFVKVRGEHSGAIALDELRDVANLIEFRQDYDRDQALQFLRKPGTLAVMPSLDENSPCTVFECIVGGIPFIASNVGGIPELVAPKDQGAVLFEANAKALAARLLDVAANGLSGASLAFDPDKIEGQMFRGFGALHEIVSEEFAAQCVTQEERKPLVSVVVTHFNRPEMLRKLLKTLEKQTYENFEVIVVDDGSTRSDAIAYVNELAKARFRYPFTLLPIKNSYLGAARNAGVQCARGEYLKFQDDDNIPMPHELEYFVRAATTSGADVVTAMSRFFGEESELEAPVEVGKFSYFPMGASLPISLFRNEYGDANALVRRTSFLEDGGFSELYGVGHEDHEFFIKSECHGRKIILVPEPIFNYRVADGNMLRTTSAYHGAKRVRSGLDLSDRPWLGQLIDFAQEVQIGRDIADRAWWRAGQRINGVLHRQMMDGDPSSKANVERFVNLAIGYERFEDVVPTVLRGNAILDSLAWLERQANELRRSKRQLLRSRGEIIKFDSSTNFELVSPTTNFPLDFRLADANECGVLCHPLVGQIVEVRIPGILPAKLKHIAVLLNHRGVQGRPVRAQIAIYLGDRELSVSNWIDLSPGLMEEVALTLRDAPAMKCDLWFRTTVDTSQHFCWIYAEQMRVVC